MESSLSTGEVMISIGLWKVIFYPIQKNEHSIKKIMSFGQSIGVMRVSRIYFYNKKMETNQEFKGYRGKTKTGSKKVKSKFDTPKPKAITPISGDTKIKIRKEDKKIRLESF